MSARKCTPPRCGDHYSCRCGNRSDSRSGGFDPEVCSCFQLQLVACMALCPELVAVVRISTLEMKQIEIVFSMFLVFQGREGAVAGRALRSRAVCI